MTSAYILYKMTSEANVYPKQTVSIEQSDLDLNYLPIRFCRNTLN